MGDGQTSRRYRKQRKNFRAHGEATAAPCWICRQPIDYSLAWPDPQSWELDHLYPRSTHPQHAEDPACFRHSHRACNNARVAAEVAHDRRRGGRSARRMHGVVRGRGGTRLGERGPRHDCGTRRGPKLHLIPWGPRSRGACFSGGLCFRGLILLGGVSGGACFRWGLFRGGTCSGAHDSRGADSPEPSRLRSPGGGRELPARSQHSKHGRDRGPIAEVGRPSRGWLMAKKICAFPELIPKPFR